MATRHLLTFLPAGLGEHAAPGETLLAVARRAGAEPRADCGGQGVCGKCRVKAAPAGHLSPPDEAESALFSPEELAQGWRLACRAKVTGPLEVELPAAPAGNDTAPGKTGLVGRYPVDGAFGRRVLPPAPRPSLAADQPRDLAHWVSRRVGNGDLAFTAAALAALAGGAGDGPATLVRDRQRVTMVLAGDRPRSLGLAVDLGTTTVAAYLCDLASGRILAAAGRANPQRAYGEDVISRIAHLDRNPGDLPRLREPVVAAINQLAGELLARMEAASEEVDRFCLVGNPTMQHIFLGFSPRSLGRAPYLPATRQAVELPAARLGLALAPWTRALVFPVAAGFIGGDAVAAALACGGLNAPTSRLVIDLGTNGELVLLTPAGAWAASAATGPALEGANISCGVRAVPGAVHRVTWDPGQNAPRCALLGAGPGVKAVGLCGSGLIDAAAALRRAGVIRESGRLAEGAPGVVVDGGGVGRAYELLPAAACAEGQPLRLALTDLRQLQLAKAALAVGIEYLLERAPGGRVDQTILTGAFGANFDWQSAVTLGLLPRPAALGRIETVENAAGLGAVLALLSGARQAEAEALAATIQVIELNQEPDFNARFVAATSFPPLGEEATHAGA